MQRHAMATTLLIEITGLPAVARSDRVYGRAGAAYKIRYNYVQSFGCRHLPHSFWVNIDYG